MQKRKPFPSRKNKDFDPKVFTCRVVRKHRLKLGSRGRPLSFARFADALAQPVRQLNLSVSYQAVKNWEDGIYRPDYFFILQLANHAPEGSWQRAFAMDILAVQWPELYQPGSEIGRNILQNSTEDKKTIPLIHR